LSVSYASRTGLSKRRVLLYANVRTWPVCDSRSIKFDGGKLPFNFKKGSGVTLPSPVVVAHYTKIWLIGEASFQTILQSKWSV
jgi:hypothetical protein